MFSFHQKVVHNFILTKSYLICSVFVQQCNVLTVRPKHHFFHVVKSIREPSYGLFFVKLPLLSTSVIGLSFWLRTFSAQIFCKSLGCKQLGSLSVNHTHLPLLRYSSGDASAEDVDTELTLYRRIMDVFPDGVEMAFAYGSAVYKQKGHLDRSRNMIDVILVVDHPNLWHHANLSVNRHHYSFVRYFGKRFFSYLQNSGSGVFYNTLVPFEDRYFKYGVVSTDHLIADLLDWETLYVSGRLHKPVKVIKQPSNAGLMQALCANLHSAVHAALLLLPEEFCEEELYQTITSLSFNGDFRMMIGEDVNKVANIVLPNVHHFRSLYRPILAKEVHVRWHQEQNRFQQDLNHVTQFHHLQLLPKTVLLLLQERRTRPGAHPDLEEVLRIYANSSHCDECVAACLHHIVRRSSTVQALKAAVTAGGRKSVIYAMGKLKKMYISRKQVSNQCQ